MSKNSKGPPASLRNAQPGEQIEQDQYYATPDIYLSKGTSQFRVPLIPRLDAQTGEQVKQNGHSSASGTYSANGTPQFRVPPAPLPGARPAAVDPRIQQRVNYYADWLAKQAKYDALHDNSREINDYIQEATKVVKVGKKEIAIFAPFRLNLSALQTFTGGQVIAFCVLCLLWLAGLFLFRLQMVAATVSAIIAMYTFMLILDVSLTARSFRASSEEDIDDEVVHALKDADWPLYTILCPLYREAQVVPQFVRAMLALDYPPDKLQILFLTEADDAETRNAIRELSLPPQFRILFLPDGTPRTKPRACNYGLIHAQGSYVVIYDAEDVPDPLQLKKAVLTFANHETDVVCVQAKLNFYNVRQNLLTRWFTAEYSAWFDLILPGLQLAGFFLPLGGTSNHFRTGVLRALGAWDAYNVTEDCDLGLRLKRYHMKTVILDSTTLEEANSQLRNWLRQRSRWIKGYMQTYLVHMRHPLEFFQKRRLHDLFSFQVVIGSAIGVIFINPLMWLLLGAYVVFGHSVIEIYHRLFPGPVLYLGAFCLIFGNFFYVYLYLLACMKRKQYHLLPWTLFIPLYWLLMSVAGLYALFELLVNPHYWQKTVHGLHLKGKQAQPVPTTQMTIEEPTMPMPIMPGKVSKVGAVSTVPMSLKAIPTLLMPAVSPKQKQAEHVARRSKVRDLWLVATIVTACITSIIACWYYFHQNEILLYEDAYSHLRIARSVFDNITPGIAQLGTVWLPLPHILMWPFIWNDYLWHSGLAGSFVSMPCYVIAAIYLFLSARRLTGNSGASFIGTLAFIFNPNILYLQSTPLSETVCIATLMMGGYYFLAWVQEGSLKYLVFTAGCTFLVTLARYDGWALFLALFCLIPIVGLLKHQRLGQIRGNLIVFGVLGGFGIVLWLIWNKVIFGDPLFFQRGIYSSQAQQNIVLQRNQLYSYHNLWQAVRFYTIDFGQTVGPLLCLLGAAGLIWSLIRYRVTPNTLGTLVFLVPFVFYVTSLYGGQAILWVPAANPPDAPYYVFLYNVRYGAQMVAPVAFFVALLLGNISSIKFISSVRIGRLFFLALIVLQCVWTTSQGVLSLQDGQYNYSCFAKQTVNHYLAEHYNGGKILEDVYAVGFDSSKIGIDFKNIIYEGSGPYWLQALHDPADMVDWIVVKPDSNVDLVASRIDLSSPLFLSQFTLVAKQDNNVYLYHRLGRPPLPTRVVPYLQVSHLPCREP